MKCGTPLKRGQGYCMKCGYNNQTGAEEKLSKPEEHPRISFKSIFITALTVVLSCLAVYFVYQFMDQNVDHLQKIFTSFSRELLKTIAILLGISIFIESLLAYRTMDNSLFKSLFEYIILYTLLLGLLFGYSYMKGTPINLASIPIIPFLVGSLITGLFYFLAKWLTSNIIYKMKTGKYSIFFVFYAFFRILSWILFLFLIYFLLQMQIITL